MSEQGTDVILDPPCCGDWPDDEPCCMCGMTYDPSQWERLEDKR